jgi:hypothetical protein
MSLRKFFLWSTLGRLVNSQLSRIGAAATIIVPIIFAIIAAISEILVAAGIAIQATDTQILWRFLASELYLGGLLIMFSRFVVDVFCPDTIQRYPTKEEYVAAAATYRNAICELNRQMSQVDEGDKAVLARLVDAISRQEYTANEITKNWESQNASATAARIVAGLLFYLGGALILIFLAARLSHNMKLVLG